MWDKINWKKVGIFFGGFAFGTVGLKALFSKDAKKCYTHVTRHLKRTARRSMRMLRILTRIERQQKKLCLKILPKVTKK